MFCFSITEILFIFRFSFYFYIFLFLFSFQLVLVIQLCVFAILIFLCVYIVFFSIFILQFILFIIQFILVFISVLFLDIVVHQGKLNENVVSIFTKNFFKLNLLFRIMNFTFLSLTQVFQNIKHWLCIIILFFTTKKTIQ